MNKKVLTLLIVGIVVLLAAAVVIVMLMADMCVFAAGGIYPAHAQKLDLRARHLTVEKYEEIQAAFPDCDIRWKVPFQDDRVDCDTQVLKVDTFAEADMKNIPYFRNLKAVDGSACADASALAELSRENPDLMVLLNVTVDGKTYNQDTESIVMPDLTAEKVALLEYLPKLSYVDASGNQNIDYLLEVNRNHPQWHMTFDIIVRGMHMPGDLNVTALENCTSEELQLMLNALGKLESLKLVHPRVSGLELQAAKAEHPNVDMQWTVAVNGVDYDSDAEEVTVENMTVASVEDAMHIADYFPNLKRFVLIDTGLENEVLAAYRDEVREQYKVVWKLYLGSKCTAMSDDTWFFPTQQRDYYFQNEATANMRYLEDCIAVDVGDQPNVKNVDWAAYMPHLQYLILAHTNVKDISPLANCKELKFLELDLDHIAVDLTPLVECTALEDLNLGYTIADASPLYGMTWLRRLWWTNVKASDEAKLREVLGPVRPEEEEDRVDENGKKLPPKTDDELAQEQGKTILRFRTASAVGGGWRRMEGYYAMRDALHAPYDKTNWG